MLCADSTQTELELGTHAFVTFGLSDKLKAGFAFRPGLPSGRVGLEARPSGEILKPPDRALSDRVTVEISISGSRTVCVAIWQAASKLLEWQGSFMLNQ